MSRGLRVPIQMLFDCRGGEASRHRAQYAVARDGRFLINQPVGNATTAPITLILNWNPQAKTER
jgi:hypothetical protein